MTGAAGAGPRRPARAVDGAEVGSAEAHFAAEASRLPARFGIGAELDGFMAWRAYTGMRAVWRAWRRVASTISTVTGRPVSEDAYLGAYPGEEIFPARHPIKHVFFEVPGATKLAVVFSGFELAYKPKYNYIGRFGELATHRLHILDDMGTRGCYYLGRDREFYVARDIARLVDEHLARLGLDRGDVVCLGSSKGGTAALYHALTFGYGEVIAAAPQTYLGKYLRETVQARDVSSIIAGGDSAEDRAFLDSFLFETARSSPHRPRLRFFISPEDNHYEIHLQPFLEVLDAEGYEYEVVLGEYASHSAVGPPFSSYVLRALGTRKGAALRQAPQQARSRARGALRRLASAVGRD